MSRLMWAVKNSVRSVLSHDDYKLARSDPYKSGLSETLEIREVDTVGSEIVVIVKQLPVSFPWLKPQLMFISETLGALVFSCISDFNPNTKRFWELSKPAQLPQEIFLSFDRKLPTARFETSLFKCGGDGCLCLECIKRTLYRDSLYCLTKVAEQASCNWDTYLSCEWVLKELGIPTRCTFRRWIECERHWRSMWFRLIT